MADPTLKDQLNALLVQHAGVKSTPALLAALEAFILPSQKLVAEVAARQLVQMTRDLELKKLRLRCAEIVWMAGSQEQRINMDTHAERIYTFCMAEKKSA